MFLQAIYIFWKYLVRSIAIISALLFIAGIIALILLQVPSTRSYFIDLVESNFQSKYHGQLHIESIEGFIPFNATIHNISFLYKKDELVVPDTIVHIKSIKLSLNPLDLLSNKLSFESLSIVNPTLNLELDDDKEFYTINRVFEPRGTREVEQDDAVGMIELLAPFFTAENGIVRIELPESSQLFKDGTEFIVIEQIHLSSFVELTNEMRFIDLQYLFMKVNQFEAEQIQLSGQVYSDDKFLEFNGFSLKNGNTFISITGEIENFNIVSSQRKDQLMHASYSLTVDSSRVKLNDFSTIWADLLPFNDDLFLDMKIEGDLDELFVDKMNIKYGQSNMSSTGEIKQLRDFDNLSYLLDVRELEVRSDEIISIFGDQISRNITILDNFVTQGRIHGDFNSTDIDLILLAGVADLRVDGYINWNTIPDYQLIVNTNDFNLNLLLPESLPPTILNSKIQLSGKGTTEKDLELELDANVFNSMINQLSIDRLHLVGNYIQGLLDSEIELNDGETSLSGSFKYNHTDIPSYDLVGIFKNVDLSKYIQNIYVAETDMDFEINLKAQGQNLTDVTGIVNMDVNRAIVDGDSLKKHQFYADLLDYREDQRELRFTSTLMDFNLRGDINPEAFRGMYHYWYNYLKYQIHTEILLTNPVDGLVSSNLSKVPDDVLDIEYSMIVKDATLIQKYIHDLPLIDIDLELEGNVQANSSRVLINNSLSGSEFYYGESTLTDYSIIATASLQYGMPLKEFSVLDLVVNANELNHPSVLVNNMALNYSMLNDSARVEITVGSIGKGDYGGELSLDILLTDSLITTHTVNFEFGNQQYKWTIPNGAQLGYSDDQKIEINELNFVNSDQWVRISGVYSPNPNDLISVIVENFNLETLSDIVESQSTFSGIIDGNFTTSMLSSDPVISGDLFVDHLKIDRRTLGDVNMVSKFDNVKNRFDVELQINTDSIKYADYLASNFNIGQDISLSGYINGPGNPALADTLFYFDVDMPQIDAWIIQPIVPSVFVSTEGVASGTGSVWGRADFFDFNARLDVGEIKAVPRFILTNYTLKGRVDLSRESGVLLQNIEIRDRKNGIGMLNGSIGFNDFQRERPFNLTMDISNLEILNNPFDPDIPFYGNVSGSGRVSLTGSNLAPNLRTLIPVTTTTNSRLSIPLLNETSVEEQSRFIEFVKSFSDLDRERTEESLNLNTSRTDGFIDIARMDLQFIVPLNSTVQLVFDPLTGEVLNATGSGRIRLTLDDQNFQMFGNFDIDSGDYVFVGGDIFVRRFQLRDGGTISWVGDPANATLNITTAYRSRPNIGVLASSFSNQQNRIPVDLMLEITGTIQNIQNNFYFELPNATDVSQHTTALSLLNSEDQKLIQATSLLFTGGFIPVGTTGEGQTSDLGASLQARAGQVGLSQLLSNQINAILNSSLSNLDIDLNLTGFDQADIGIALRLFDDRLVLRGESQYTSANETGSETTLGDFGITYRINKALSLEVFHRRDPTLRSIVGNQSQAESINGVGLEAQVQFNSWREFKIRILSQIRRIFGSSKKLNEPINS